MTTESFRVKYPNAKVQADDYLAVAKATRDATWSSQERRDQQSDLMSEVMTARFANLTDAERLAWSERSSESARKYLESLTPEEYEAYCKTRSEKAKQQDLTSFVAGGKVGFRRWYDNMPMKEYRAYCTRLSETHKARFACMSEDELRQHMLRSLSSGTTRPELEVVAELKKLGFKVVPKFKVGRFEVDAYLADLNLAIEMYGDYWHGSSYIFKASDIHPHIGCPVHDIRMRDRWRVREIKKLGYNVAIVWESDLCTKGFEPVLMQTIQDNTEPSLLRKVQEGVTTEVRSPTACGQATV